jgi:hypothetical protein
VASDQCPNVSTSHSIRICDPDCLFGIQNDTVFSILGESLATSAYIVLDYANNELSIAQTRFNATKSNIIAINNGTNGIPGAVRSPGSSESRNSSHSSGLSTGAKVGVGVGVSLGIIILVGLIGVVIWLRRRDRKQKIAQEADTNHGKKELAVDSEKWTRAELPASEILEIDQSEISGLHTRRNTELSASEMGDGSRDVEEIDAEKRAPVELPTTLTERCELEANNEIVAKDDLEAKEGLEAKDDLEVKDGLETKNDLETKDKSN